VAANAAVSFWIFSHSSTIKASFASFDSCFKSGSFSISLSNVYFVFLSRGLSNYGKTMPEPLIILRYARVSTREQALNSHALEQQEARLKEAGAMKILTDVQSGRKNDRIQLKKLTKLIEAGEVKKIIWIKIST
jgi:hypothetical protein